MFDVKDDLNINNLKFQIDIDILSLCKKTDKYFLKC